MPFVAGFIIWILLCFLVSKWASGWGRDAVGYFFLSLILSPAVGALALLLRGKAIATAGEFAPEGKFKKCPFCAENIRVEAVKCRYCGESLAAAPGIAVAEPQGIEECIEALSSPDVSVREAAIWTLGRMGAGARAAIPHIQKAIRDPERAVRARAAWALEQINRAKD